MGIEIPLSKYYSFLPLIMIYLALNMCLYNRKIFVYGIIRKFLRW